MRAFRTIRGFILTAALAVSLLLFAAVYTVSSGVFERAIRNNAVVVSETLAEGTFNAMFQIMRRGWTRPQLEEFIAAIQKSTTGAAYAVAIYRGEPVTALFGPIEQDEIDPVVNAAFTQGTPQTTTTRHGSRYTFPLTARSECLRCHTNATEGTVLGVIDVRHQLAPLLDQARGELLTALVIIAPLPFLVALLVAFVLGRRFDRSMRVLGQNIDNVNRVADLTQIDLKAVDLGLEELNGILHSVEELTRKLRTVAVDKDLLEFEIRLLDKFVITSEVVRDWREYIGGLLVEINQVITTYILFSIFKVDEEQFDLEIFWLRPPTPATRVRLEEAVRAALHDNVNFVESASIQVSHHVTHASEPPLDLIPRDVELQTKSLLVDAPRIGGIVGIGVQADMVKDSTRRLVLESILSTLLNVVGSVKAIYKYTKDLEYYATRDPLTNIYNQRLFWELLGYEVVRAERNNYPFALLVIDLDNFKTINDTYGHSLGDRFLQRFAEVAHTALRGGDVFARYGGDEFVAILPETDAAQAQLVAERILANASSLALDTPDGSQVHATASIGVAIYPDHAGDVKDLFLFADNMMYKAKSEGKDRVGMPTEQEVVEVFRSIGEKSIIISNAIEQRRVVPYFQAILDVKRNEVAAIEVLSRIQLPGDRVLGAHEFIEIAEKMGIVHKLDYIVMEKTFAEVAGSGYPGMIFLNLSPRALIIGEFIREVRRMTHTYGIAPQKVVFEITERDTVKNMTMLERFVNDLKLEGFQLAIDDFGSGFSSFHYLKHFSIDFVKIEGDFVRNMARDRRDNAFVYSIANLARELNIKAVAEFVEDADVLHSVEEAGIGFAQGYHIRRPTPELAAAVAPYGSAAARAKG